MSMMMENGMLVCVDYDTPHLVFPKEMVGITVDGYESFCGLFDEVESIAVEEGNPCFHAEGNCLICTEYNLVVLGCKNSVIPEGITSIGHGAFGHCHLRSLTIPPSVKMIDPIAFKDCGLERVVIPRAVTLIGDGAFCGEGVPDEIVVEEGNARYESVNGCLIDREFQTVIAFAKHAVIPEGVKTIGMYALMLFGEGNTVTVPSSVETIVCSPIGIPPSIEFPVTVKAPRDSYAARFAAKHRIKWEKI